MKFTLNRDKVVVDHGHAIHFKKGEATHVPYECFEAALAAGAQPDEEMEDKEVVQTTEPADPKKRKDMILKTMADMASKNSRDDFTGNGTPAMPALTAALGFKIDASERDTLWAEYLQSKG